MITKLRRLLEKSMSYVSRHMMELAALGFFSLFVSWHIGFYANGVLGYHFELNSVWQGISTLFGAGVFASIKYVTDSCKNSAAGEKPYLMKMEGAKNYERDDLGGNSRAGMPGEAGPGEQGGAGRP